MFWWQPILCSAWEPCWIQLSLSDAENDFHISFPHLQLQKIRTITSDRLQEIKFIKSLLRTCSLAIQFFCNSQRNTVFQCFAVNNNSHYNTRYANVLVCNWELLVLLLFSNKILKNWHCSFNRKLFILLMDFSCRFIVIKCTCSSFYNLYLYKYIGMGRMVLFHKLDSVIGVGGS